MDFFEPAKKVIKGVYYVAPKFKICRSKDLMIRGRDFYAIWDEENQRWSRDQDDAIRLIDGETKKYVLEKRKEDEAYVPQYMWDSDSGVIDRWNKYVQKQMRDNYRPLDNKVIFSNTQVKREDYSTHRLNYPLEEGPIPSYEELMSTLYEPDERKKLEWAIGAIVSGDSVWIQKFIVIVGDPGTGKSTFFKILRMLFPGYFATINAKALGDGHSAFALEPLKNDPLVAIEDDADLSKITDNTRLNSLISHEPMTVNEKFKSQYENTFHAFLFLGTNKDVKITDSASGLTRRLIDVVPSGNKVTVERYNDIMKQIPFELGGIAYHCLKVYTYNKKKYNDYVPVRMLRATNLIYNFLEEYQAELFSESDGCRFYDLWNAYNTYCDLSKVQYSHTRQEFRNELRPYFREYLSTYEYAPGQKCQGYYAGFKFEKLGLVNPFREENVEKEDSTFIVPDWLNMDKTKSIFDEEASGYSAQYANEEGNPTNKWSNCKKKLKDISTNKLHWVKMPENHIVIDFDIRDENGKKNKRLNQEAASKFPKTYAEWSKSGCGIHLHYIYKGDVSKLSRIYDDNVEIKVFTGNSSLRRKLVGCNDVSIAEINSGLPLKGDGKKVIDKEGLQNEKAIRTVIKRNINKEYHAATAPSVQFIFKVLEDAYNNKDLRYDVTDLRPSVLNFAANSTNQADKCLRLVSEMRWKSEVFEKEEQPPAVSTNGQESPIVFYDVEVFPNLFVVCWSSLGSDVVVQMINPSPKEIENLYNTSRLIGFNNRKYDAHIMYARMMGYTNAQLFSLSQKIIGDESKNASFSEAYRTDYADIYDISTKKQSLKKWEIDLGFTHLENAHPWDQPVDEKRWKEIAEYCSNDVLATKKVFEKCMADYTARLLLSELSGLPVIDTNRQHITKIIFGNDRKPNLLYTDLATGVQTYLDGTVEPTHPDVKNYFSGYEFNINGIDKERYSDSFTSGKSIYMGEDPSEGGFVYSEPGMYYNVWCFDVSGMHPASIIAMNKFGKYTKVYKEIRDARLYIKHKDFESAKKLLDGKLEKYLTDESNAKDLSNALKLILNSTYGFCSASFDNPFRDPRDKDNIVAKRGALFMITLKNKVIEMGYKVIHCKTDSIKVVNPDEKLQKFIDEFGKQYGYLFEVEHKFEKICLVNRAVYIGKYSDPDYDKDGNEIWWDATGAEFAHPYIFKSLFTHEPITFKDYCETKQVTKGALYLDMNENYPDVSSWEKLLKNRHEDATRLSKRAFEELYSVREMSDDDIISEIKKGHNYQFIGRIGQFVPIISGRGGGELVAKRGDKYPSVSGVKGYRWLEAEFVKELHREDDIDKNYYRKLIDDAIASIEEYGDANKFINSDEDAAYPF